jgi:CheY-like chemotaxis protein
MSHLLDREVVHDEALVVDSNPMSRSVMVQHLKSFGFGTVKQAGRVLEARDMLERRQFDLVVCDYYFENGASGQELLEELRREQMLPYSTVFVMVTGEATYSKVSEGAEAALDSYLVKPFSGNTLFERVKEARQRKRVLKEIFEAIEAHEYAHAAALCQARFQAKQIYWLFAARIAAELLMNLKRNADSRALCQAVVEARPAPWARLGVARAMLADGEITPAKRTLEALIQEQPQFADSYDVMGKVQMEQGLLEDALATYGTANALTPGCILRLQHCGTLNFYVGSASTAIQMLERTWQLGHKSRLFDVLSMMLLAFLRLDSRDTKGLVVAQEVLARFAQNYPQSLRLQRMAAIGSILVDLNEGRVGQALQRARDGVASLADADFDMEAANNVLSLWSRLARFGVEDTEYHQVVSCIARRFSVSKATTELLVAAVQSKPEPTAWIRETHAEVMKLAEEAMNHAIAGKPKAAVHRLLTHGAESGNAKLIDLAGLVAQRHRERIEDVDAVVAKATSLSQRYCAPTTHLAGIRRSNRSAGGLVLRR